MYLINHRLDKWVWLACIVLLSGYVVYEHATDSMAIDLSTQVERHNRLIAGNSEFYNPWQYRILSPLLVEGVVQIYKALPFHAPVAVPYLAFHFAQIVLLLILLVVYFRALGLTNPYLNMMGLLLATFSMSHSVFQSDLSFNTYFDIIFYLLAALVILNKHYLWIIPITILAALNRETSGFIPLMLLAAGVARGHWRAIEKKEWLIGASAMGLFIVTFISIRLYFGYRVPEGIHGMQSSLDYIRFNLGFMRMYPELIGTLGVVPLLVLIGLKRLPIILKSWFWLIVPAWFVIHFIKSTAMESRLFLVPQIVVLIPALLWLVQDGYKRDTKVPTDSKKLA